MNIMNIFWGFIAEVSGLVVVWVLWSLVLPLMNAIVATGTMMYYMGYISLITLSFLFIFVFPWMTVMADEEGGAFKKIITRN